MEVHLWFAAERFGFGSALGSLVWNSAKTTHDLMQGQIRHGDFLHHESNFKISPMLGKNWPLINVFLIFISATLSWNWKWQTGLKVFWEKGLLWAMKILSEMEKSFQGTHKRFQMFLTSRVAFWVKFPFFFLQGYDVNRFQFRSNGRHRG